MITVLNGKLTIPESQRFIGFAGDNLVRTIQFLILNQKETDRIYRLYLTFDDDTVNYFTLPSRLTDAGVVLTWDVRQEHIFKSGNVKVQIKGFSQNGVVYHTTKDTFIVGNSAEFSDNIKKSNTEFLQYEEKLNSLKEYIDEAVLLAPYIGDNGNWFIYDSALGEYKDSGKSSAGKTQSGDIAQGAVTSDKIANGAINSEEKFSSFMKKAFLSFPLKSISVAGDIQEEFYDQYTQTGIYQIDSYSGIHNVLVVLKPFSDAYLMQILMSFDKVLYRGIFCKEDGVYSGEEWTDWCDLCKTDIKKPSEYYEVDSIGDNADPHLLSYQTSDPTTDFSVRIPLSVLKTKLLTISDEGNYFEGNSIESALQEIGAELNGLEDLLSKI